MGDDLGTHAEGVAGFLVDHQVDVALAVALLGVGQAMVLVRQRTQRLGQQAHAGHVDVQVALARAGQHAFGADDVAQVPGLDLGQGFFRQGLAVDVDLQALAAVLEDDEGTAVEHDPTGHLDRDRCGFQLFLGLVGVLFLQVREVGVAAEVVGKAMARASRTAASFSLRWAISLFSSCCSSCWSSCWSLMVLVVPG